jgi:hypothetical protein
VEVIRVPDEAIEVLRAIWRAQGQDAADLDELCGSGKSCKKMSDVGFDDLGGGDPRAAWRATLAREGKLKPGTGTVRDLVLGTEPPNR